MKISGEFKVEMSPQQASFDAQDSLTIARMALDKTYSGELNANSKGEMLSVVTTTQGSAGYVAIEQVTGTLSGTSGSFALQHSGIMNQGDGQLTLVVIPDSATGELLGLTGKMAIRIEAGVHFYDFEYELN